MRISKLMKLFMMQYKWYESQNLDRLLEHKRAFTTVINLQNDHLAQSRFFDT